MSVKRKLTVIFYADIADYSRLSGTDEAGTHQSAMTTLDLTAATIEELGGTVLRYAGDAILAEIASVTASVEAAISTQTQLSKRNASKPELEKVQIRVGVNLGEVLEDRGEIYGDGVNLAARLESIAEPGGLCISAPVFDQID